MTSSVTSGVSEPRTVARSTARVSYRAAFWGLIVRDTRVLSRSMTQFLLRTVIQPFLFVFVFLYVFPNIGAQIHGPARCCCRASWRWPSCSRGSRPWGCLW